jgi:hypothetical protein
MLSKYTFPAWRSQHGFLVSVIFALMTALYKVLISILCIVPLVKLVLDSHAPCSDNNSDCVIFSNTCRFDSQWRPQDHAFLVQKLKLPSQALEWSRGHFRISLLDGVTHHTRSSTRPFLRGPAPFWKCVFLNLWFCSNYVLSPWVNFGSYDLLQVMVAKEMIWFIRSVAGSTWGSLQNECKIKECDAKLTNFQPK